MFFDKVAQIIDGTTGDPVPDADTTFNCWIEEEGGGSETARGERYDATGVVDVAAADELVRKGNRKLKIGDATYSVVGAIHREYLPHVEVLLAELRPAG